MPIDRDDSEVGPPEDTIARLLGFLSSSHSSELFASVRSSDEPRDRKRAEIVQKLRDLEEVFFLTKEQFSRLKDNGLLEKLEDSGVIDEIIDKMDDFEAAQVRNAGVIISPELDRSIAIYTRKKEAPRKDQDKISRSIAPEVAQGRQLAPDHPGLLLQQMLRQLGVSVAAAARSLGVSRQHFFKVVYGEIAVSAEMAVRLDKGFGIDAAEWLRMQAAYDLHQIDLSQMRISPLTPAPLRQAKRPARKSVDRNL